MQADTKEQLEARLERLVKMLKDPSLRDFEKQALNNLIVKTRIKIAGHANN